MKKLLTLLALTSPAIAFADLPTNQQYDELHTKKCGLNWPSKEGAFIDKPLFALKGVATNLSVHKIEEDSVELSTDIGKTLKSVWCTITGCELKTTNYYYVDTSTAGLSSIFSLIDGLYNSASYQSLEPGGSTTRSTSFTFNTRGVTHAMVHRFDEQVVGNYNDYLQETEIVEIEQPATWGGTNSIFVPMITTRQGDAFGTVGFNQSIPVSCDANFVFVQNKPTIININSASGTNVLSKGYHQFSTSGGSMDTSYSRNALDNQNIQYYWSAINLDAPYSASAMTTSKSASLNLRDAGEYLISVRSFDGTYYSTPKTLSIEVVGATCSGPRCTERN